MMKRWVILLSLLWGLTAQTAVAQSRNYDVNLDGEVNIADVNGDGEVNIADINAIIDYILGIGH